MASHAAFARTSTFRVPGIGTRDTAPFDTFQLLKVGQIGGNVDCLVEHEIEAEDLMVDDIIVEIVPEDSVNNF